MKTRLDQQLIWYGQRQMLPSCAPRTGNPRLCSSARTQRARISTTSSAALHEWLGCS